MFQYLPKLFAKYQEANGAGLGHEPNLRFGLGLVTFPRSSDPGFYTHLLHIGSNIPQLDAGLGEMPSSLWVGYLDRKFL